MSYEERKARVLADKTAKAYWYVTMGLQLVGLLGGAVVLVLGMAATRDDGMARMLVFAAFGFILFLALLILWGTWKIERWVSWLMWVNVVFSAMSALSGNIVGFATALVGALMYHRVVKVANGEVTAGPQNTPPPVA